TSGAAVRPGQPTTWNWVVHGPGWGPRGAAPARSSARSRRARAGFRNDPAGARRGAARRILPADSGGAGPNRGLRGAEPAAGSVRGTRVRAGRWPDGL